MSEQRWSELFKLLDDPVPAAPADRPAEPLSCPDPEELASLATGQEPSDPALLSHVARCEACAEALHAVLASQGSTAPEIPATTPAPDSGHGRHPAGSEPVPIRPEAPLARRRWLWVPAAAAAAVLVVVLVRVLHRVHPAGAEYRAGQEAVVFLVEGQAHRQGRALKPGSVLAEGSRFVLAEGSRVWLLESATGQLSRVPGSAPVLQSSILRVLAAQLGPERGSRRRTVQDLPDTPRGNQPPDFLAIEPRGGVREDRPSFRFHLIGIGPEEELILRVLDENGVVHLEHRFHGAHTLAYPESRPALARGRRYVWSIFHPRSGPGPLGGDTFRVLAQDALAMVETTDRTLERLSGAYPAWMVSFLRGVLYHQHGLHREALDALPDQVPDPALNDFLLEERALLLDKLGYGELVGPLKQKLGLPRRP